MKKRISECFKTISTVIRNKDYTARESVFALITIFVCGILLGIACTPKRNVMIGSHNGNNNTGGNKSFENNKDEQESVTDEVEN